MKNKQILNKCMDIHLNFIIVYKYYFQNNKFEIM